MIKDKVKKIALIYEGIKTEKNLFESIKKHFFMVQAELVIVTLPADGNIYMLWSRLKADDFETDLIHVLKEMNRDISEKLKDVMIMIFQRCIFSSIMIAKMIIFRKNCGKEMCWRKCCRHLIMKRNWESYTSLTQWWNPSKRFLLAGRIMLRFIYPCLSVENIRKLLAVSRITVIIERLQKRCGMRLAMPAGREPLCLCPIKNSVIIRSF